MFIDNEYIAADTMRLLLENGGNPNLQAGIETIFEVADYDTWFGRNEMSTHWRYDAWVHVWFVLLAFGGHIPGNPITVETLQKHGEPFDIKALCNHRSYSFELNKQHDGCFMRIFEKHPFREVARLF